MVKDRLAELKQSNSKDTDNASIQMENDTASKLRQTFERADVIGQWIQQIEKNNISVREHLRKLENLNNNHKDIDAKLEALFQNNTSLAHQISNKFKEVDEELGLLNGETAEIRIKNIQQTTLKTRFQKAFIQNSTLLEDYKNVQKQIVKAQLQAKGYFRVTDEEVASLLEEGTDIQVFTENILAETADAKRMLADIEERHQQLVQIERMLTEVRDMFVQMSILVESQQELIDRIDFQAQSATEYIGAVDLKKVRKQKRKYTRRKIYIILALIILFILILVILLR